MSDQRNANMSLSLGFVPVFLRCVQLDEIALLPSLVGMRLQDDALVCFAAPSRD